MSIFYSNLIILITYSNNYALFILKKEEKKINYNNNMNNYRQNQEQIIQQTSTLPTTITGPSLGIRSLYNPFMAFNNNPFVTNGILNNGIEFYTSIVPPMMISSNNFSSSSVANPLYNPNIVSESIHPIIYTGPELGKIGQIPLIYRHPISYFPTESNFASYYSSGRQGDPFTYSPEIEAPLVMKFQNAPQIDQKPTISQENFFNSDSNTHQPVPTSHSIRHPDKCQHNLNPLIQTQGNFMDY